MIKFEVFCSARFHENRKHYAAHVGRQVRGWDNPELSNRLSLSAQNYVLDGMDADTAMCTAYTFHVQENALCH